MKKKIYYHPQPSDLEELYAQYCFESDNSIITLDKRDVNSVALHATLLFSYSFTGTGECAIRETFESLVSAFVGENICAADKVLMRIVCKGGILFGCEGKHQLEAIMAKFNPDTSFKFGIDEKKSSEKEVDIFVLVSINS